MVAFVYSETDLGPSVIDTIVKVVLGLGSFATLFGIVVAINLIRGKPALGRGGGF